MQNALKMFVVLLMFAAFFAPKSHGQILGFYPAADTIFAGGGCTTPFIICSMPPAPPAQDMITVTPDWNTWMWHEDEFGVEHYIDFGYFLVNDSLNQFEYEVWYIPVGWPSWGPLAVPFDSLFLCEGYIARLQLKVLLNGAAIDSFSQPWVSVYGLPVEPEENAALLPSQPELRQNFPNPFNAATTISYRLPNAARVNVAVYDVAGRLVAALMDAPQSAGEHSLRWDAGGMNSGVYFIRLRISPNPASENAGEFVRVQKAILSR